MTFSYVVGYSIDKPEVFASWIGDIKQSSNSV